MPAKITNFIPGSCFGYYDEKFKQCLKCKINKSCKRATESQQVDEVRKIFKFNVSVVEELSKKYK